MFEDEASQRVIESRLAQTLLSEYYLQVHRVFLAIWGVGVLLTLLSS